MTGLSDRWRFEPSRPENAPRRGKSKLVGDAATDARRELRLRDQPRVVVEDMSWMADGACRGLDPNVMVPERGDMQGEWIAKRACAGCRVAETCLAYATAHPKVRGVWGGTSGKERRARRAAA